MKIVVYTQRVEYIECYNERRDCTDQRIAEYIKECGFLPIPLSNNSRIVSEIIDEVKPNGIVLAGGNSLFKYGGDAPERDDTDKTLIEIAVNRNMPLYGFCRGMQSILDYFGNRLIIVTNHVAVRHKIYGVEDSLEVNSYHNQGCTELKNDELVVLMKSEDGVIEKIKHKHLPIIGTMWHPERENPFKEDDMKILKTLIGGTEK